jgi:TPR repeat protein
MDHKVLFFAAQRGEVEAQWELGRRYYYGDRVDRDPGTGRRWILQAAAAGHEEAKAELARQDAR